jgi:hypothetical protein
VADRIGHVRVLDELGPGRRTGGEVQEERLPGPGGRVRGEVGRLAGQIGVGRPTLDRVVDADPDVSSGQPGEPVGEGRRGDDDPDAAAVEPVGEFVVGEQGAGRDDDGPKLGRGQHRDPQRRDVAEHEQQPVAPAYAEIAEMVGQLVGPRPQVAERELLLDAVLMDDPQRQTVRLDPVEVVQRPVVLRQLRPAELGERTVVVRTDGQQESRAARKSSRESMPLVYPTRGAVFRAPLRVDRSRRSPPCSALYSH